MKFKAIYGVIIVVILIFGVFFIINSKPNKDNGNVPNRAVHWHPNLKIIINGEEHPIPPSIGITVGNNIDHQISGMMMSPTHTHETDGTIHLENSRPWEKPETLTLGYFFEVWGKSFNSSCIFDYCDEDGIQLSVTINGQPNYEFEEYVMQDKDAIVIEYV